MKGIRSSLGPRTTHAGFGSAKQQQQQGVCVCACVCEVQRSAAANEAVTVVATTAEQHMLSLG